MTDSLRLFQSEEEYNAVKDSLEYPTVSYVEETDNVYYIHNSQPNYFFIEALADGMTVALNNTSQGINAPANDLEYSTDQQVWQRLSNNTASPAINTGERIYLRGNATSAFDGTNGILGMGFFNITQQCNVGGNIMSLLFNDDFEDKTDLTGYDGAFAGLFMIQPIVNASELILPATTLADNCYYGMFQNCASLTTAPALPATTLSMQCYTAMFQNCTSLTAAPALPATSLATTCYMYMFMGCSSLTTAPELPATTLVSVCYAGMFYGCSNLNYIKMLATDVSVDECLNGWVNGVPSTGTFVKNSALSEDTIGRGENGIPEGWTVVNA